MVNEVLELILKVKEFEFEVVLVILFFEVKKVRI